MWPNIWSNLDNVLYVVHLRKTHIMLSYTLQVLCFFMSLFLCSTSCWKWGMEVAMLWIFVCPPPSNLYAEVLISSQTMLEDEDFRRWLGHWGWAFRNQILALMKDTWRLHSFHHVRSQQEVQMSIDLSTCYSFHL